MTLAMQAQLSHESVEHHTPPDIGERARHVEAALCGSAGSPDSSPALMLDAPGSRQVARTLATLAARFWAKVDKSGPTPAHRPELGPCWLWTGATSDGYGRISAGARGAGTLRAHRVSYELHHGSLDEDLVLLHACDNRRCVRPEHLTPGTQLENVHDMIDKGRAGGVWFAPAEPEHAFADLLEAAS